MPIPATISIASVVRKPDGGLHPPLSQVPIPVAAKNKSESFDFVIGLLQKTPEIAYADVAAAAQKKGYKIYPIVYGRAKAKLGLVPTAPRGTGEAARAAKAAKKKAMKAGLAAPAAAAAAPAARAVRRNVVATTSASAGMAGIESVISHVKASEAARERYKKALERIRAILEEAIS